MYALSFTCGAFLMKKSMLSFSMIQILCNPHAAKITLIFFLVVFWFSNCNLGNRFIKTANARSTFWKVNVDVLFIN